MIKAELNPNEYDVFYSTYIDKLHEESVLLELYERGMTQVVEFFKSIPKEKIAYKYEVGKWSVKEVFQHIIDTERVFMHRCFRISRHDSAPLAGFNQNDYIQPAQVHKKTLNALIEEYRAVRNNSIVFLKSVSKEDLTHIGNANGSAMSGRAAAFAVIGHERHHIQILKERYLP
ncbi:DinB family protein [Cognatitamlana onchidii]|uniref:DinB family protein n=1 Tax=Cognatitamlana onchidii TaxID=2562860 RepID=UPI0010A5D065|nr:DinB family protein [Algibacter onchidii]